MRSFLSFVLVMASASFALCDEWPEFTGVYLKVGDKFTVMTPVPRLAGTLTPHRQASHLGGYRFGLRNGRWRDSTGMTRPWQFINVTGIGADDFVDGIVAIDKLTATKKSFSIVTVQRPSFAFKPRVNQVAPAADFVPALTPMDSAKNKYCSRKPNDIQCHTGSFDFRTRQAVPFLDAEWGWEMSQVFGQRLISDTVTEYVPLRDFCINPLVGDVRGNRTISSLAYILTEDNVDGRGYLFACEDHLPYVNENTSAGVSIVTKQLMRQRVATGCKDVGMTCPKSVN